MTTRLIIVSNRLPVTMKQEESGTMTFKPSAGGLATGLNSLDSSINRLWIGWPGTTVESEEDRATVTKQLQEQDLFPVFLSQQDIQLYYEGFSNMTIWPLFHYFPQYVQYNAEYWAAYKDVNERFAKAIEDNIKPGDIVWVQDYQLMLVPGMLRLKFHSLSIGFFLHIPFPSFELFRSLPWRIEILNGILGADMIGFHTFDYMRHFLSAVYRLVGYEHTYGRLEVGGRAVKVDALPMGIDYDKFATVPGGEEEVSPEMEAIEKRSSELPLILSVDRLDYSKGIPGRVKAFEMFLRDHPEYLRKVILIMVVVPSRDAVDDYAQLKDEIELLVGRINGEFGTFDWIPIRYFYRPFSFPSLCALYRHSQVALVTPLRDGMNLVAKEYVASKTECKRGVLILSEMAGAASELDDAVLVNPCDQHDMANAIFQALEMAPEEQEERMGRMQRLLKQHDVKHWAKQFIETQLLMKSQQEKRRSPLLTPPRVENLVNQWGAAKQRLLVTDYGGTLMPNTSRPQDARPNARVLRILKALKEQPGTTVVLTSGRDHRTLHNWFGSIGVDLVAEFGACQYKDGVFQKNIDVDPSWKQLVRPMLDQLAEYTVGSFVEEKEYTVAWHFRNTEKAIGHNRLRDIREQLIYFTANHDLQVVEGDSVVEIRHADVSKGRAASHWVQDKEWDIIVAIGNDDTDEDIFKMMPKSAWTVKVGLQETKARCKVTDVAHVQDILEAMAKAPVPSE